MVQVHPGPPISSRKPKRTSEPPPVGNRTDRACAWVVEHVHWLPPFSLLSMTRSSMSRNPAPQAGKPGASPGRVAHSNFHSSASIEVMQQTFNLPSTEHSRGGGPTFSGSRTGPARRDRFESGSSCGCGMGSISSGFRQFPLSTICSGLAEQSCTCLVSRMRPGRHRQPDPFLHAHFQC